VVKNKWINQSEAHSILTRSKIGLNLSFQNPGYDREHTQISPRVYSILECACMLVTEKIPLLQDSLAGVTYLAFESELEIVSLIQSGLAQFNSQSVPLKNNQDFIRQNHTYAIRSSQIITLGHSL